MTNPSEETRTRPVDRRRLTALALALVIVAGATGTSFAEAKGEWIIPPDREEVLAEVLGARGPMPGGCQLTEGDIQFSVINATYVCNGNEITLLLSHPSKAGANPLATTDTFAISAKAGNAPAELVKALTDRIDAVGDRFAWEIGQRNELSPGQESAGGFVLQGPMLYGAIAAALVGLGILGFIVRRA